MGLELLLMTPVLTGLVMLVLWSATSGHASLTATLAAEEAAVAAGEMCETGSGIDAGCAAAVAEQVVAERTLPSAGCVAQTELFAGESADVPGRAVAVEVTCESDAPAAWGIAGDASGAVHHAMGVHLPSVDFDIERASAATGDPVATGDYDTDDDGLIEVSSLLQLNAIRFDLDGDGAVDMPRGPDSGAAAGHAAAFPDAPAGMGCPSGCVGYELMADLDFDTNGDGRADAGDEYWNAGKGWAPLVGDDAIYDRKSLGPDANIPDLMFTGVFEGNGRTIANLYIDDSRRFYVGLFGYIGPGAHVRNVGLTASNADSKVTGRDYVGALAAWTSRARISGVWSDVDVAGDSNVGGLIGRVMHYNVISESYATGDVAGEVSVGGLAGRLIRSTVAAVYATGDVRGWNDVGGLAGTVYLTTKRSIAGVYATGSVSVTQSAKPWDNTYAGGLFGSVSWRWVPTNSAYAQSSANYSIGQVPGPAQPRHVGGLTADCSGMSASSKTNLGYWDTEASAQMTSRGCGVGYTTAQLQTPTSYEGIYANWNLDLDGDSKADDPWDFGTSSQYPVLKYCASKPGIDTADTQPYCPLRPAHQRP